MNVVTRPAAGQSLEIVREYKAAPARVFAAWTDPEQAARWWVPQGLTLVSCRMDVRPGGGWHRRMRLPDGSIVTKWGAYREVVSPRRLVFTYITGYDDGRVDPETLVTVTFEDLGGRTRLTLRHEAFWSEEASVSHDGGWAGSLDGLDRFMSGA